MPISPEMYFFPQVPSWIHPDRPSFPLHKCGRCGLRHGWNSCRALFSTCLKCGRRGHYARMCRTRKSGSVNTVSVPSSPTMRTIGTQTEEKVKQKSTKKQRRDAERIKAFTKAQKERKSSTLSELPFSTVDASDIKCENLEVELNKFKEMVAKLKRESQFFQNVCKQERKCSAAHIRELRVELKKKADDLEATLQFQRELEYSLAEKEKENCQLRKQQREPQNPHTSDPYPSQFPRTRGINRAPPRTRHPCPINTPVTGSVPSPRKFYRKHEDVFRGARGNCHRAKRTYLE